MADDSLESNVPSEIFNLRHISSSFSGIPGLFIGFNNKGPLESDSLRSPTTPLDFKLFSNLTNSLSLRSPKSSNGGHRKKWDSSEKGLGIVTSIANDTKVSEDVPSLQQKHIIFGRQVKTSNILGNLTCCESSFHSLRSKSLPKDYMVRAIPETRFPNFLLGRANSSFANEKSILEHERSKVVPHSLDSSRSLSSLGGTTLKANLSLRNFCPEKLGVETSSASASDITSSCVEKPPTVNPISIPIPTGHGDENLGSLSAEEIELSEDYTCIISHGPNSKTTHIFGDCILECYTNESSDFVKNDQEAAEALGGTAGLCGSSSASHPPDGFIDNCCFCNKKFEEREEIFLLGSDKSVCCNNRQSGKVISEVVEKSFKNNAEISSESSFDDELFPGMPFTP